MAALNTHALVLAMGLSLGAFSVAAEETINPEIDINGDGLLTMDEIDTDDDGTIDEEEMQHAFGSAAQVALAKFDADGDGIITLDEVRNGNNAGGNSARALGEDRQTGNDNGNDNGNGNGRGNGGNGGGNGKGNGRS